jgi:hypothetical protein
MLLTVKEGQQPPALQKKIMGGALLHLALCFIFHDHQQSV